MLVTAILLLRLNADAQTFTELGCYTRNVANAVVRTTIPSWKLFTKLVAQMDVVNLVVNLRHTCSCRTPIVNLEI